MTISIALYQPDIPQNAGTIARAAACLGCVLHIIEPAGFATSEKAFRRAGMDYLDIASIQRHVSYEKFLEFAKENMQRVILMTTRAELYHHEFQFQERDILMMGRESAGVPDHIHEEVDARLKIPMNANARSLNIAFSCAMVLNEALSQTKGFL